jgi:integrase
MGRRGSRTRVFRNVYQDATGYAIIIRHRGKATEYRYPSDYDRDKLKKEQARLERERDKRKSTSKGSIAADVERYLKQVTLQHMATVRAEAMAWHDLYPKKKRYQLTREDVLLARKRWHDAGLSPKSINHRVNRLRRVFKVLDGDDAWTPCDRIPKLTVTRTPIVRTDVELVNRVLANLLTSEQNGRLTHARWRARLMVVASCGRRPSEVGRTEPTDVDLINRIWIPRDGKGGFTEGGLYLNDDQLAAWQLMVDAEAFGTFDVSEFVDILKHHGWPTREHPTRKRQNGSPAIYAHPRPYNLRHTHAMTLSESGHDLADISPMLGHRDIETTRAFYAPVLNSRMQRLSESLNGRFGWTRGTERGTDADNATESTR